MRVKQKETKINLTKICKSYFKRLLIKLKYKGWKTNKMLKKY